MTREQESMPSHGLPKRQIRHITGRHWAVLDEEGEVLYSGTLTQCEDKLDADENRLRVDATEPRLDWLTVAARLPIGLAYLLLAAVAFPLSAFGRLVASVGTLVTGSDRDTPQPVSVAFELRRRTRRTRRWIFNNVPAPWALDRFRYE